MNAKKVLPISALMLRSGWLVDTLTKIKDIAVTIIVATVVKNAARNVHTEKGRLHHRE